MKARVWKPPHTRTRVKLSQAETSELSKQFNNNGSLIAQTTFVGRREYQGERLVTDVVTPGYASRSAKGEIFNSPFSSSVVSAITPKGNWQIETAGVPMNNRVEYSGSDAFFFAQSRYALPDWSFPTVDNLGDLPGSKSTAAMVDIATISARSNVVSADTLALVTLAELAKTVAMVTQSSTRLRQGISLLLQGKPKQAILQALGYAGPVQKSIQRKAAVKTAASKWLEIRYGWLPLVYDVLGTLQAFKAEYKPRFTARGFANDSATGVTTGTLTQDVGLVHLWKLEQSLEKRVRAYILYEVDKSALLPQKLGLLQIPQSIWELAAFSFVVDWFVDIGSWLDAASPRVGVNILAEGYTMTTNRTRIRSITGSTLTGNYRACTLPGQNDFCLLTSKVRVPKLPSFPLPRVNVKFNPKRAIDSIALLVQQASKLR